MDETFYLTNMCPQVGDGFNRDYWSHFEDFVRRLTNKYDDVRVMTGPLYLPKLGADGKYRVTYEVIGSPKYRCANSFLNWWLVKPSSEKLVVLRLFYQTML